MENLTYILTDDSDHYRRTCIFALNRLDGIECIGQAENGELLLEMLKTTQPDFLFLDINMPILDGEKALVMIKAFYPKIKVIMLSMHHDYKLTMRLLGLGANSYITKDSDIEVFVKTIQGITTNDTFFNAHVTRAYNYVTDNAISLN